MTPKKCKLFAIWILSNFDLLSIPQPYCQSYKTRFRLSHGLGDVQTMQLNERVAQLEMQLRPLNGIAWPASNAEPQSAGQSKCQFYCQKSEDYKSMDFQVPVNANTAIRSKKKS